MGHNLCILTAGLLLGQSPEVSHVTSTSQGQGSCSCSSSNGGFQRTRTWSWSSQSSSGWTEDRNWTDDRPILGKIQERLSNLFGRDGDGTGTTRSGGEVRTTRHGDSQVIQGGQVPVIHNVGPGKNDYPQRMPSRVSQNEPPLLDAPAVSSATAPAAAPSAPGSAVVPAGQAVLGKPTVSPAGFQPVTIQSAPSKPLPAQVSQASGVIRPELVNKIGHEQDYNWITGQLHIENGSPLLYYATPQTVDRFGGRVVLSSNLDLSNFRSGDLVSVHGNIVESESPITLYHATEIDLLER